MTQATPQALPELAGRKGAVSISPAPWHIVRYGDGDSLVIHDARPNMRVCFMATPGSAPGSMAQIETNARLIVGAPEMIDALRRVRSAARFGWLGRDVCMAVETAIARAKQIEQEGR